MSHERPTALTSAKAAAQMRAQESAGIGCGCGCKNCTNSRIRAGLLAQADAVRECAKCVEAHPGMFCHGAVQELYRLAADLDEAAKELS